jgi:hypothetical protein
MKPFLLAALLCWVTALSLHADVVVPRPSQLTVSNLSAFPKVKFTMVSGQNPGMSLKENNTYELRADAQLYVEDTDNKPRLWLTIEHHDFNSQAFKVHIKEVRYGSKGLEVGYDMDKTALPPPQRNPPHRSSKRDALSPILIAGLGCCGLVLIAPRSRRKAAKADAEKV